MLELYLNNIKVDMSENFKVNMTYQQTDLEKPEAKKNNYSKTVSILGTTKNNKIFSEIYKFNKYISENGDFNPNKKIDFTLLKDGDVYERGYAQLDKIKMNKGIPTYDITLYGGIGGFFYKLMYDNDGNERTLADLMFDFTVDGIPMDAAKENKSILFEYNYDFVKKSWDIVNKKKTNTYNTVLDTDLNKFICPIPCNNGFNDMDNDTVLYNVVGSSQPNYDNSDPNSMAIYQDMDNHRDAANNQCSAYPFNGWYKLKLDREITDLEAHDLRSHYLPYALRLQNIYDAIKDTKNNGGYIIDDSNVNEDEKKYINEAYVCQGTFDWSDINTNAVNTTLFPTFNRSQITTSNNTATTASIDVSEYLDPNFTVHIMPRIQFNSDINTFYSFSFLFPSYHYKVYASWGGGARWFEFTYGEAYQSAQIFYVEQYDANNNLLKTSDLYYYGDKTEDGDGKKYYSTDYHNGWAYELPTLNAKSHIHVLSALNKRLKQSSNEVNVVKYTDSNYLASDENANNAVDMNFSHWAKGYSPNNGYKEYVGEEFIIDLKLLKQTKRIDVKCYNFSTRCVLKPYVYTDERGFTKDEEPASFYTTVSQEFFGNFRIFGGKQLSDWTQDNNYKEHSCNFAKIRYSTAAAVVATNEAGGMLSGQTQIYDGSVETQEERHTVNKYALLYNTNSPYEYFISLGKMFNWRFEYDSLSNKVFIYSMNNYYKNIINDISCKINRESYSIVPITAKAKDYTFNFEISDSYPGTVWKQKHKNNYGEHKFVTDYEFDSEPYELLKDCIFKVGVPYSMRSVYFNNPTLKYPIPLLGKRVTYKGFSLPWQNHEDVDSGKDYTITCALINNKLSQNIFDLERISFFDKDYTTTDSKNALVFFNTTPPALTRMFVSNNIPIINQLNDNNCHVFCEVSPTEATIDAENSIRGSFGAWYEDVPLFGNTFINNDTLYYSIFNAEEINGEVPDNSITLYDICWKKYFNDLYNRNNKVVTIKYHLTSKPKDALKEFYTFDNTLWVLNKINNYNVGDYFTECEFIQVQDVTNYTQDVVLYSEEVGE